MIKELDLLETAENIKFIKDCKNQELVPIYVEKDKNNSDAIVVMPNNHIDIINNFPTNPKNRFDLPNNDLIIYIHTCFDDTIHRSNNLQFKFSMEDRSIVIEFDIYINENYRNYRYGTILMHALKMIAFETNAKVIKGDLSSVDNTDLRNNFYKNRGFDIKLKNRNGDGSVSITPQNIS